MDTIPETDKVKQAIDKQLQDMVNKQENKRSNRATPLTSSRVGQLTQQIDTVHHDIFEETKQDHPPDRTSVLDRQKTFTPQKISGQQNTLHSPPHLNLKANSAPIKIGENQNMVDVVAAQLNQMGPEEVQNV